MESNKNWSTLSIYKATVIKGNASPVNTIRIIGIIGFINKR